MDEDAKLIQEHSPAHPGSTDSDQETNDFKPSCPFCVIAKTYPPVSPLSAAGSSDLDSTKLDPPSFVLFSNAHVIAFLDIMPLTRGHVLVAPRKHRVKIGHLSSDESAEIGRVLPVIVRSVLKSVLPDIPHDEVDYNVVQNNGPGAAQVVPHVHFHVIPRPPLNYSYPPLARSANAPSTPKHGKYPPNEVPPARARNAVIFGRGTREDLDEEESEILIEEIRQNIKDEFDSQAAASSLENLDLSSDPKSRKGGWKV
ncbi:hypothetical protein LTR84_003053 [Exophiala bonariae]|uniref:HIT domain-containing protein n=1 Tax=Exophiala bonariae TaxID=1690606 RepID=A0AAV9N7S3_9EURO|nr:hypothetical protein LTR84_003053 [Exophiala bonariae]